MTAHQQPKTCANGRASGHSVERLVRRYRVSGICFVPHDVEMYVEATTAEEAIAKAKGSRWQAHIVGNSSDESSAFDWLPAAEELYSTNASAQGMAR